MDHMDLLLDAHSHLTLQLWQCHHFMVPVGCSGIDHVWNSAPSDTAPSPGPVALVDSVSADSCLLQA